MNIHMSQWSMVNVLLGHEFHEFRARVEELAMEAYDRRQRGTAYEQQQQQQQHYPTRPAPNPPSFYPRISPSVGPPVNRPPPPVPGPAPASGIGIKVQLKPEYRVAPPMQLSPLIGEVPRTGFQFDFDFERRVIADAERGWVRTQVEQMRQANGGEAAPAVGIEDPVISKYVSMGFNKEAVALAVAAYGDVQNKVMEFCPAYNLLREMGFPSDAVAGALVMYDNDKERALAHFV